MLTSTLSPTRDCTQTRTGSVKRYTDETFKSQSINKTLFYESIKHCIEQPDNKMTMNDSNNRRGAGVGGGVQRKGQKQLGGGGGGGCGVAGAETTYSRN